MTTGRLQHFRRGKRVTFSDKSKGDFFECASAYARSSCALTIAGIPRYMADSDFECALRYRNMAEKTRIAAGGAITHSARDRLLKVAADYDAIAEMYESKFRKQNA